MTTKPLPEVDKRPPPPEHRASSAGLLTMLLGGAAVLTAIALARRTPATARRHGGSRERHREDPLPPLQPSVATGRLSGGRPARVAERLRGGAATLAFSVLADSTLEHYRGAFHNRVMYAGPALSGMTLIAAAQKSSARTPVRGIFAAAVVGGFIGTAFHLRNVLNREGGVSWLNLMHGAPAGAPLGLTFAGLFGLVAGATPARGDRPDGLRGLGRATAVMATAGLIGTAAEAGLLHFRGAYHNPAMYLPVTLPPLSAAALAAAALSTTPQRRRAARLLLRGTATAGLLGAGFHAWGVHRNMGGWRNWSQMLQQGPPLPAPPSFTGMALAGLAALEMMEPAHG